MAASWVWRGNGAAGLRPAAEGWHGCQWMKFFCFFLFTKRRLFLGLAKSGCGWRQGAGVPLGEQGVETREGGVEPGQNQGEHCLSRTRVRRTQRDGGTQGADRAGERGVHLFHDGEFSHIHRWRQGVPAVFFLDGLRVKEASRRFTTETQSLGEARQGRRKLGSFAALRMTGWGWGLWIKFFCFFLFTKRRILLSGIRFWGRCTHRARRPGRSSGRRSPARRGCSLG